MQIKITDKNGILDDPITASGTAINSKGGTEQMYEGLQSRMTEEQKQMFNIICSRVRPDSINWYKNNILWLHDLAQDPESAHLKDKESRDRFDHFVFVSYQQFEQYAGMYGITHEKSSVIKNAIVPLKSNQAKEGPLKLIYHTTPHRGLEILVPVFEHLQKQFDIELDVYSSFNIYGPQYASRDSAYASLFEECRNHPRINYHGFKPNSEIRDALSRAHIFALPSIWPETSCIAMMEAMSAGCAVVCSDLAALPETTAGFAHMYRYTPDIETHASRLYNTLAPLIANYTNENHSNSLNFQKAYADAYFNWDYRINEWNKLFNFLVDIQKEV